MSKLLLIKGLAVALGGGLALLHSAQAQMRGPVAVESYELARDAFAMGSLDAASGALPQTLWDGAKAQDVAFLLALMPARPAAPSLGEALRVTLLSPGAVPENGSVGLGGRKLLALARAGYVDEVRTLASLSNAPRNDPWVGQALASADLLEHDPAAACARNGALTTGRDADFWVKLRVFCYVAAGERDAADLTYSVLRDRGALSDTDEQLLQALVLGTPLKSPPAIEDALHFAIAKHLAAPLSALQFAKMDGGVLKALLKDEQLELPFRLAALQQAAGMGVVDAQVIAAFYASVPLGDDPLSGPLADLARYREIAAMTAPEFLRDKAVKIADALRVSDSFTTLTTHAVLYDDALQELEGALLAPSQNAQFALARMVVGDSAGASSWLRAMLGTGTISGLDDDIAMEFIELVNLLGVLDPVAGESVAATAGVALETPFTPAIEARSDDVGDVFAQILRATFVAMRENSLGQASLSALAISSTLPTRDPLGQVVLESGLQAAGLEKLAGRYRVEMALMERYGTASADVQPLAKDQFVPRLKPKK